MGLVRELGDVLLPRLYHGAKVPLPWRDMAWDPPAGGAGSVNFSPLHGGAPDYEPPGGM